MAKLISSAITSLDGYIADEDGNFDWAEPPEDAHAFVNDLPGIMMLLANSDGGFGTPSSSRF